MKIIDGHDVIEHAEVNGESREFIRKLTDYIEDAPVVEPKTGDLIKREDAIKVLAEVLYDEPPYLNSMEKRMAFARNTMQDIPSAEKQGEWITEEKDSIYGKKIRLKCSECGDTFDVSEKAFPYERFCRYCGARMKGADDG